MYVCVCEREREREVVLMLLIYQCCIECNNHRLYCQISLHSSISLPILPFISPIFTSLHFTILFSTVVNDLSCAILFEFLLSSTKKRIDNATQRFTLPDTSHINTHNAHVPAIFVIQVQSQLTPALFLCSTVRLFELPCDFQSLSSLLFSSLLFCFPI